MIDIHCHILPDLDDGAADLRESMAMARIAAASGTTHIIATPHFPGEEASLALLPKLLNRYDKLLSAIARENLPLTLAPGAEILCLPETAHLAKQNRLPTLGETNYLLCEFYFNEVPAYMNEMLRHLADCGYRVVVAHPERYEALQRNPSLAADWFARGYVLQLNKGSCSGAFGTRVQKTALHLLEQGLYHLAASDAHRSDIRTTDLHSLRQQLEKRCPARYVQVLLEDNPGRLIRGQDMAPTD